MPHALALKTPGSAGSFPAASRHAQTALRIALVYQDTLTRQWAAELLDRVMQFAERGDISCKSWNVNELAQHAEFDTAVQAAGTADVLVVAVRDNGELPLFLHVWIDAWMPRRAGREGALVAILGMPALPGSQCGRTHQYLKAVARRAGLDFLPHERSLSDRPADSASRRRRDHAVPRISRMTRIEHRRGF